MSGGGIEQLQRGALFPLVGEGVIRVVDVGIDGRRTAEPPADPSSSKCPMCARSQTSGDMSGETCRVSSSSENGASSAVVRARAASSSTAMRSLTLAVTSAAPGMKPGV